MGLIGEEEVECAWEEREKGLGKECEVRCWSGRRGRKRRRRRGRSRVDEDRSDTDWMIGKNLLGKPHRWEEGRRSEVEVQDGR